jgi:hypothetical protein
VVALNSDPTHDATATWRAQLEQVGLEASDEGQAGSDNFVEAAVVGEEEIYAGGCGDGR